MLSQLNHPDLDVLIIGSGSEIGKVLSARLIQAGYRIQALSQTQVMAYPHLLAEKANKAKVVCLCTHGHVSETLVNLLKTHPCVIDSSPWYRHDPDWHYGFFNFEANRLRPTGAPIRVATAGCLAQAASMLLRPIVAQDRFDNGFYEHSPFYQVHALLPASAGGSKMLKDFSEDPRVEVLSKNHRHAKEVADNLQLDPSEVYLNTAVTSHEYGIVASYTVKLKKGITPELAIGMYKSGLQQYKRLKVSWINVPERRFTQELAEGQDGFFCGAVDQGNGSGLVTYFCVIDNIMQGAVENLYEAVTQALTLLQTSSNAA